MNHSCPEIAVTAVPELLEMLDLKNAIVTADAMSCQTKIEEFAQAAREHWGIENQLHWCLDIIFREDAFRAKRDNSPLNMNVMRKTALPLLQATVFGRMGIRKKMFRAAMSIPALQYILTGEK